jgi:hypothetical protein
MKLLLDECLPRKLKSHLREHECSTVPEQGWAGKKNGELLLLAEKSGFVDCWRGNARSLDFARDDI